MESSDILRRFLQNGKKFRLYLGKGFLDFLRRYRQGIQLGCVKFSGIVQYRLVAPGADIG